MKSWARRSLITLLCLTVLMNPVSLELIQAASPNEHVTLERVPAQSNLTYTVDRLTDANSTGGGEGAGLTGDLRYAITHAKSGDRITFNVIGTVNLSNALPLLTQDVNIQGPSNGGITLRGSGNGNVLAVGSGTGIVISNLTITGGVGNGGGIFNNGMLTLDDVTVSGNKAGDPTNGGGTGAGIWNYVSGTLTVNNSTISSNTVLGASFYNPSRGGGIANYGTLTLNNSTVSGNSASEGSGGGISNTLLTSVLTLNNSTVSGNSATGVAGIGGGLDNHGTFQAGNSIIGSNTATQVPDLKGNVNSLGHNLIGNTTGGSGFRPDLGDLLNVNPKLGHLQNNGGTTETMALLVGSPAIDTGKDTACAAAPINNLDQRGVARPQGTHCDIGAFEGMVSSTATVTRTPSATPTKTRTATPTPNNSPILVISIASQDGWISELTETSGTGGTLNKGGKVFKLGDSAANQQYRAILAFDTSALPNDANITSVTLKFKHAGLSGANPFKTHGNLLADVRRGAFSNNVILQIGDFEAAASKSKALVFSNTKVNNWYSQSFHPADFPVINRSGVTQFRLRFTRDDNNDFGADFLKIYSGNADEMSRPQLIIEYYVP